MPGRSGLYRPRPQSDQTDRNIGPTIRKANRRLPCVLMRIADTWPDNARTTVAKQTLFKRARD
jgi:hypothetical protein